MKNMKGYFAGMLTTLLMCCLIVTAGAKNEKVMQELTYRDIRVSLDGEVLDLRNAIGDKVEPFMFDGTNYLPVRALAEALGLNVAWDGKEVMVVLTTPEPEQETATVTGTEKPAIIEQEETTTASEPVKATLSSSNSIVNDCNVVIKTARLLRKNNNELVIVATIQWTNGKSYAISAAGPLAVNATQNDRRLEEAYYLDGYDASSSGFFVSVQPGETLEFERAFLLKDTNSPIEITVFNDDEPTANQVKMTFNPSEMIQPTPVNRADTHTSADSSSPIVYITDTGKHYHYSSSCNGGTYYPATLYEAISRGLTPCDKCT